MNSREKITCACGSGTLEVKFILFGTWRVEEVIARCPACGSRDVVKARRQQQSASPPSPVNRENATQG